MFLNTYMSCALARLLSTARNTKSRVTRWCIGPGCYSESYPVITTSLTPGFLRTQDSHNAITIFRLPLPNPTICNILCCLYVKLAIYFSDLIFYSSSRFVRTKQLSHFKSERPTIRPFQSLIYTLSYLSWFSMMPFIDIFSLILSFLGCGIVFPLRPLLPRNVVSLHIQTAPFKLGKPSQFILPALLAHHISYSPLRQ
jgi:hypothetical protein